MSDLKDYDRLIKRSPGLLKEPKLTDVHSAISVLRKEKDMANKTNSLCRRVIMFDLKIRAAELKPKLENLDVTEPVIPHIL